MAQRDVAGATPSARVWKEVRLDRVRANVAAIAAVVGPATRVMAVVKADAYGHGLVACARAALRGGASRLGVASPDEAARLRDAGVAAPIHLLGALAPGEDGAVVPLRLVPLVHAIDEVRLLARAARRGGRRIPVHLKVDTGMGRLGAAPQAAAAVTEAILGEPALRLEGVATHLAAADAPDLASATAQIAELDRVLAAPALQAAAQRGLIVHAAASAGLLRMPAARRDLVRPGLAIYGLSAGQAQALQFLAVAGGSAATAGRLTDAEAGARGEAETAGGAAGAPAPMSPALSLRSRVVFVKEVAAGTPLGYGGAVVTSRPTRVATVACGYHDGYPLLVGRPAFDGSGEPAGDPPAVLVRGRRCPLLGRTMMDYLLADVTAVSGPLGPGERVTLLGRDGSAEVAAADLARWAGTIPYEVVSRLGPRVRAIFLGGEDGASLARSARRADARSGEPARGHRPSVSAPRPPARDLERRLDRDA